MAQKHPFHVKDYQKHEAIKGCCPLLEVIIGASQERIVVYADTGCTVGLSLLKRQIGNLDLGKKINDDPYEVSVADGHVVEADLYETSLSIDGVQKDIIVYVVNPEKYKDGELKESIALLGRGFLDNFDVMFKGKDKKIELFEP